MGRKRILIFCLVFISGWTLASAKVVIEAKGMYFQPSDQNFKDIYGGGSYFKWISYGGEISVSLWKGAGVWAGGHYFTKKGTLTYTGEDTEIKIMPIYGGIKLRLLQGRISPYLGAGVGYFKYKEENPIDKVDKGNIGYIGQAGLIFRIFKVLVIDIQASYTYCKVKPVELEENLGGIQTGIGLGLEF